jgi:hypothetical protein
MIIEGRLASAPSSDVVAFRDRLEESTYAAREKRGTQGTVAPVASTAPRADAVSVPAPVAAGSDTATTAPIQPAPAQTAPQQGFQPVNEGEIRTESLDGGN